MASPASSSDFPGFDDKSWTGTDGSWGSRVYGTVPRRQRAASASFAAAYRDHADFVWRVLARYGVEVSALEDATQEVFIVAHRQWGDWEERGSMRAWLYGVARRVALKHYRTRSRRQRRETTFAAQLSAAAPDLDARLDAGARLRSLARAIDSLSPNQREVFILADIESMSAPAIAEVLGCKLNTVYSRLRRARAQVEAMMDGDRQPPAEDVRP